MTASNATVPQPERRKTVRTRVLLRGLVCNPDGAASFSCAIRELTERGARIALPDGRAVPTEICLINVREKVAHDAILLWHNHVEAGFALLSTLPLTASGDPRVRRMYELCAGSSTASSSQND